MNRDRWRSALVGSVFLAAALDRSALAQSGSSQPPVPLATTLPVSVRFAGLGGASVAVSGDAGSVFSNPTGLATLKNIALEGSLQRYPDGTVESSAAGAFRLLQFDLGGGYQLLRFSDTSSVKDNLTWVASATYRFGIFAIGGSTKYVSMEDSAGSTRRSGAVDGGLGIYVFDLMSIGFSVQNLGDWSVSGGGVRLPTSKHVGFTFNFVDPQGTGRLLGTMDVAWTEGQNRRTVLGGEAGVVVAGVGIEGRVGYGAAPDRSGQKEFSFGGSVVLSRLSLDYAHQSRTTLGDYVHRFGVRFTL
jgi:hypothetical protein